MHSFRNIEDHSLADTIADWNLQKIYDRLCFDIVQNQEDSAKWAPVRSCGKLKTALNVYFKSILGHNNITHPVVFDLCRGSYSVLRPIISEALTQYKPIRDTEVEERDQSTISDPKVIIPSPVSFGIDYTKVSTNKRAFAPYYENPARAGYHNESAFREYIDNHPSVLWWSKQADSGVGCLATLYRTSNGKPCAFYPDWIIQTKDHLIICDTKSGFTLEGDTNKKLASLLEYCTRFNSKNKIPHLVGGIVTQEANGVWKMCSDVESFSDRSKWKQLNDVL